MHSKTLEKYLSEISEEPRLTTEEELDLANKAVEGDDSSREALVKSHLKLVIYIAKQYKASIKEIEDLVSEGNHGLMIAAERYDPSKGAKFSTFAAFYIKSKIREYIFKKNKTINIPLGAINKYFKIKRAEEELKIELDREPSSQEISNKLGVAESQVINLRKIAMDCRSIDEPTSSPDGDGISIGELIPDPTQDFVESITNDEQIHDLLKYVRGLDDRDREIIKSRFGLDNTPVKTLDEIGERFNISKERVRQLQESCLSKLKISLESGISHQGKDTNLIISETQRRKESKKNNAQIKAPAMRMKRSKDQQEYWDSLKGERFGPTVL
jgi:RNA polymerase primary sigma factor